MNSIYRIKKCSIIAPLVFFFVACTDYQANYESKYDSMFAEEEPVDVPDNESESDSPEKSSENDKDDVAEPEDDTIVEGLKIDNIVDYRDGKKYKTVQVGNQVWFAENLNYDDGESGCLKDSDSLCAKYGRSYSLASIANMKLDEDDEYLENGYAGLIELCPSGWHVPYKSDWNALNEFLADNEVESLEKYFGLKGNNPVLWGISSSTSASLKSLTYGYKLSVEDGLFVLDHSANYSMRSAVRCVKGEVITNCKCGAAKLRSSSNMVSEGKPVEFEWTVKGCKGGEKFTYRWEEPGVSSEGNKGRIKISEAGDYTDFVKVTVTNEKGVSTQVICGAYPYTLNVMAK